MEIFAESPDALSGNKAGVGASKHVPIVNEGRMDETATETATVEDARDDAHDGGIKIEFVGVASPEVSVAEKDAAAQTSLMTKIVADIEKYERRDGGSSADSATVGTRNTADSSVNRHDDWSDNGSGESRFSSCASYDSVVSYDDGNPFVSAVDWYNSMLLEIGNVEERTEGTYDSLGTGTVMSAGTKDSKASWMSFFGTQPSTKTEDEEARDVYYPPVVEVNGKQSRENKPSKSSANRSTQADDTQADGTKADDTHADDTKADDTKADDTQASWISSILARRNPKDAETANMMAEEHEEQRRLAEERDREAEINSYLERNPIPTGFVLGCVVPADDTQSKMSKEAKLAAEDMEKLVVMKDSKGQLMANVEEHGMSDKIELQRLSTIPRCVKPDDIVIMVKCSSISLRDCMLRRGACLEQLPLPYVPGSEMVGIVCALGEEAKEAGTIKTGDRVAAFSARGGGNAKYATVSYRDAMLIPENVASMNALCLLSAYVPAFQALAAGRKESRPFFGADILVIGVNPGNPVGFAIAELALLEGANVYVTADESHHRFLRTRGVKCLPVDPSTWIRDLYGKMDVVVDSVCLDGRYTSSLMVLKETGKLVCSGMSAPYTMEALENGSWSAFLRDRYAGSVKFSTQHFSSRAVWLDTIKNQQVRKTEYNRHFQYLCHQSTAGAIKPAVATRGSLRKVAATQRLIEEGRSKFGINLCTPWNSKQDDIFDELNSKMSIQ